MSRWNKRKQRRKQPDNYIPEDDGSMGWFLTWYDVVHPPYKDHAAYQKDHPGATGVTDAEIRELERLRDNKEKPTEAEEVRLQELCRKSGYPLEWCRCQQLGFDYPWQKGI